jgi:hypothetical protein
LEQSYFIVYLIAAILFYKERIFLDGCYYLFHVVQSESFRVEHQRFILIPSQVLAWLGVKLHLSLQTVILLNSINPVLYLWILFSITLFLIRDWASSWALLMISVCGIYFIYFCQMYEVWYGGALLIFYNSLLRNRLYRTIPQLVVFIVTIITLLFSYPLMVIGFVFFSIYHFIEEKRISVRLAAIFSVCLIMWAVWKVFFISDYESGKISYPYSQMTNIAQTNFSSAGNMLLLIKFLFTTYGEEMIMMLLTVLVLLLRKKYLKVACLLLFLGGFFLVIGFTQDRPWRHTNYFERMYLLLIPLCMIPFLTEVYSAAKNKWLFELAFIGIIIFRGVEIANHSKVYADRIHLIESLVKAGEQEAGSKFFIDDSRPEFASLVEWSMPMDALIFSSLHEHDHSLVISLSSDLVLPEVAANLNNDHFHLRLDEVMADDWLNAHYFHLDHGEYRQLPER